jgi:hypothetical protein
MVGSNRWLLPMCLGSGLLVVLGHRAVSAPSPPAQAVPVSAAKLVARPVGFYQPELESAPDKSVNHLGLAAAHLDRGEPLNACLSLARHVESHPDHHTARGLYAELLLRVGRTELARRQFQHVIERTQAQGEQTLDDRLHSHTQLAEIAAQSEDEYATRLHRGIGLVLLAEKRLRLPNPDGELAPEQLLFRASGELALARLLRPDEARPCWYLYLVWSRLGQSHPARRQLREASFLAPLSDLTSTEQSDLLLAEQTWSRW